MQQHLRRAQTMRVHTCVCMRVYVCETPFLQSAISRNQKKKSKYFFLFISFNLHTNINKRLGAGLKTIGIRTVLEIVKKNKSNKNCQRQSRLRNVSVLKIVRTYTRRTRWKCRNAMALLMMMITKKKKKLEEEDLEE